MSEKYLYKSQNRINTRSPSGECFFMKKGKWRIEYTSPSGDKISVTIEGRFTFEKIKQLFDLIELFSSPPQYMDLGHTVTSVTTKSRDLKKRLVLLLGRRFVNKWFTSKDVSLAFYEEYGEHVPVNVIATYLARFHYSGLLIRQGSRARWRYHLSQKALLELSSL